MKLSVCIITKNECEKLRKCLSCLALPEIELIVVDTGSSDDSKLIAKEFTDNIYDFEWCNDFSKARNFAVSKATNDFVMSVDTDEYAENLNIKLLLKTISENPDSVGRVVINNEYITDGEQLGSRELVSRIFNKNLFHYEGKVHEQICSISGKDLNTYEAPIEFLHDGYFQDEDGRIQKAKRNLELLFEELSLNPKDTYILYQIGKSYYYMNDYENAVTYFEKTFEYDMNPKYEYVSSLIVTYGYSLLNLEQNEEALILESLFDDFETNPDFTFVLALTYMKNAMFDKAVTAFEYTTTLGKSVVEGVNSYLSWYNIGVIYECLGQIDLAKEYYGRCGDYSKAKDRLKVL